jgi:hypothetical protein
VYDFLSYFRVASLRGAREEPEAERVPSAGPATEARWPIGPRGLRGRYVGCFILF